MFLALREIRRARARFALLGGAVGLLVVLLLFFQSVASALTGALTGAVANQSAEVVVYGDRARQNPAASVLAPEALDAIRAVDGVAAASGVTQAFGSVVGPDGDEVDAVLVALDPGAPGTPTDLADGRLPDAPGEALVSGSGFDAGYPVGTRVTVTTREQQTLEVVGVADGASANASTTLYVDADTMPGRPTALSWVGVDPADGVDPTVLAARISDEVDGVEALERSAAVAALPGVDTIGQSFSILYLLLFVVVTIVTGVFFLILTVQKRDALVLLRAVGARRRDVVVPVLVQVVVVVGVGAVVGSVVTAGLLRAARDVFGTALSPATAATSSLAVLGLGLVAASAAVRRVVAIEPAEVTSSGGLE